MQPVVLTSYELVSANDSPERDPSSWRIEAVTEEDFTAGTVLHACIHEFGAN